MIKRIQGHCADETCPACVIAGDYIFLAHHCGGFDKQDAAYQMRTIFEKMNKTLKAAGASLDDMVQINLYMKDLSDFGEARDVFYEYFEKDRFPARMTLTSEFIDAECMCMADGVAYKPSATTP